MNINVKINKNLEYNINQIIDIFKIENSGNTNQNCKNIYRFLKKKYSNEKIMIDFFIKYPNYDSNICNILVKSVYELFIEPNLIEKSKLPISEKKYQTLLKKYRLKTISKDESNLLDKCLHIKLCRCIKKIYIKNIIEDIKNQKYNPYALCTSSIYNKRSIKAPSRAVRKCRELYSWYK